jgi:hypothetical protein
MANGTRAAPSAHRASARRRIARDVAAVLVLAALSLLRFGNGTGASAMYLPLARELAGTWHAPHDDFMGLLERLPIWWCHALAPFEARGELFPACLALVVAGRVALAASAIALAASFGARGAARYAGAALVVLSETSIFAPGMFSTVQTDPIGPGLAIPLVLLALASAARGRSILAGALLGVAADLHATQAAASAPPIAVAILLVAPTWRAGARDLARATAALAALSLPTAAFVVANATHDTAAVSRTEAYALIRETVGGHLFLSCQGGAGVAGLLGLAALALVLRADAPRARSLRGAAIAGVLVAAAGLLLADLEVLPIVLLKACLGRAAIVSRAIAFVSIGGELLRPRVERAGLARAAGLGLVTGGILESQAACGIGCVLLVLASRGPRGAGAYGAIALGLLSATLDPTSGSIAAALAVAAPIALAAPIVRRRARLAALALVACVVAHHIAVRLAERRIELRWSALSCAPVDAERLELGRFLGTRTAEDAVILAPPEERILRYLAGRRFVASSDVGTLAIWDLRVGRDEHARLAAIGYGYGRQGNERAYLAWSGPEIAAVATRVGATHVVVDRTLGDPDLGAAVFSSGRYRVYELSRRSQTSTSNALR